MKKKLKKIRWVIKDVEGEKEFHAYINNTRLCIIYKKDENFVFHSFLEFNKMVQAKTLTATKRKFVAYLKKHVQGLQDKINSLTE